MENIVKLFSLTKKNYDANKDCTAQILETALACIEKMSGVASEQWHGPAGKQYTIFYEGVNRSRPFLTKYRMTSNEFKAEWNELQKSGSRDEKRYALDEERVSKLLYSTVVPFCVCFDIWKPKSRKTPGTFFEVVLGTLFSNILPGTVARTKHVPLPADVVADVVREIDLDSAVSLIDAPQQEIFVNVEVDSALPEETSSNQAAASAGDEVVSEMSSVATDIVFDYCGKGIVIPAKITTRERIVQPFAHQKILDGVFGVGRYISLLVCVSETQRSDKDSRVNEICVPGTITLFQKHLAQLGGIYYLDTPERYRQLNEKNIISVQSLGFLLSKGLAQILTQLETSQSAK